MRRIKAGRRHAHYHGRVTRLLLLLLIALLPLRGWAADRMALHVEAVPAAVQAQQLDAPHAAMDPDCPVHLQHAHSASHGPAAPAQQGADHKSCQSCQLCMAMAVPDMAQALALQSAPRLLPRMHTARFASVDLARHTKPPIS